MPVYYRLLSDDAIARSDIVRIFFRGYNQGMHSNKLYRIRQAATVVDVPPQTLDSAARSGHVAPHYTGCGMLLVSLADVKRWAKNRPKPGRKPQKG